MTKEQYIKDLHESPAYKHLTAAERHELISNFKEPSPETILEAPMLNFTASTVGNSLADYHFSPVETETYTNGGNISLNSYHQGVSATDASDTGTSDIDLNDYDAPEGLRERFNELMGR